MPWTITVETNFGKWAVRKLKRAVGETLGLLAFVFALFVDGAKGTWNGWRIAFHDWQQFRWYCGFRQPPR